MGGIGNINVRIVLFDWVVADNNGLGRIMTDWSRYKRIAWIAAFSLMALGIFDILSTYVFMQQGHLEGNGFMKQFFDAGFFWDIGLIKMLLHLVIPMYLVVTIELFCEQKKYVPMLISFYILYISNIVYLMVVGTNIIAGLFPK